MEIVEIPFLRSNKNFYNGLILSLANLAVLLSAVYYYLNQLLLHSLSFWHEGLSNRYAMSITFVLISVLSVAILILEILLIRIIVAGKKEQRYFAAGVVFGNVFFALIICLYLLFRLNFGLGVFK